MLYLTFIYYLFLNNLYAKWKLFENCHTLAPEMTTN